MDKLSKEMLEPRVIKSEDPNYSQYAIYIFAENALLGHIVQYWRINFQLLFKKIRLYSLKHEILEKSLEQNLKPK